MSACQECPAALGVFGDKAKERVTKDDKEVKKITISILKARSGMVRQGSLHRKLISSVVFQLVADNKHKWTSGGIHIEKIVPHRCRCKNRPRVTSTENY